jgi:hypothetical protein
MSSGQRQAVQRQAGMDEMDEMDGMDKMDAGKSSERGGAADLTQPPMSILSIGSIASMSSIRPLFFGFDSAFPFLNNDRMKWRDHKRLAYQMAETFGLKDYQNELVNGSVEPDQRKEVVHIWSRAKDAARSKMYKARRALIKGDMAAAARYLGIVSHYIEDGIVHGAMDTIGHSADHSTLEGEIGARADIAAATPINTLEEGLPDGEFVFREIDALVREGMSQERLGRALSLLGSAVLASPEAPDEVTENRRRLIEKISRPPFKILGGANFLIGIGTALLLRDYLWLLLLPYSLLSAGRPAVFRFFRAFGWILALGGALGYLDNFEWSRLILGVILFSEWIFLSSVPDPGRHSEKWYRM